MPSTFDMTRSTICIHSAGSYTTHAHNFSSRSLSQRPFPSVVHHRSLPAMPAIQD